MMPRIEWEDLSVNEAGKMLRDFAEMTAKMSGDWDNFEEICTSLLQQAYDDRGHP